MSEEERQAIIHLLDKQARYEYCIKNNISFSDEDYEAYIIRQSMINKDKEIERLNNIINELNWKPIKEYDESNYDWVLVKYFDGNYECVPIVAEKRFGKWYSSEGKEIKFKIKYFFDMQQLDKLQELKGSDKE